MALPRVARLMLCLAVAWALAPAARAEDAPAEAPAAAEPAVSSLSTPARAAHPGSRVPLLFDARPTAARPGGPRALPRRPWNDGRVAVVGWLEQGDAQRAIGILGRADLGRLGPAGVRGARAEASVPHGAVSGRLRLAVVPELEALLPETAKGAAGLATVVLEVVPAPNLAVTALEAVGAPAVGQPLRVRWTVQRVTDGPTGPAALSLATSIPPRGKERPAPVEVEWPEGLPEAGTLSGEAEVGVPTAPGPVRVTARVAYRGEVVSVAKDDTMTATVVVPEPSEPKPPAEAPPTPVPPAPVPPSPPAPTPPTPPTPPAEPPVPAPPAPTAAAGTRIERVVVEPAQAAPGDEVSVTITLRADDRFPDPRFVARVVVVDAAGATRDLGVAFRPSALRRGATKTETARVRLPEDLAAGPWTLEVRPGPRDRDDTAALSARAPLAIRAKAAPQPPQPPAPQPPAPVEPPAPVPQPPTPVPQPPTPVPQPPTPVPQPPAPPPAAPANLAVSLPGGLPTPLAPGQPIEVPWEVRNTGGTAARRFSVSLVWSAGGADRVLADDTVRDEVAPGATKTGRLRAQVPNDAAEGPAVLAVLVDRGGRVPESDESDNAVQASVEVRRPRANLQVADASAEPGVVPADGATVRLRAVVRNTGPGPSAPCHVAFRLLRTNGGEVALGEAALDAIPPGRQAVAELAAAVPAGLAPARWGLAAVADSRDAVPETDEQDNAAAVPAALVVEDRAPRGVNLAVREAVVRDGGDVEPAAAVSVRARVASLGRETAPAFELALLLATRERPERTKGGWKGVVSELARASVPAGMRTGTEVVRDLEGTMPAGLAPGAYFLVVVADASGMVADARREDDLASAPVRLAGRAVLRAASEDLVPDRERAAPGEAVSVSSVLRNDGNEASAAGSLVLVLAAEGPKGRASREAVLATLPLDPVRPGETREAALSGRVPRDARPGRHRLALRVVVPGVDPVDLARAWLAVGPSAGGLDLAALDLAAEPRRVRAGEGVRATVRVRNTGEARSPATVVRLFLADEAAPRAIGEAEVGALAPRQEARVTVVGRVPRGAREGPLWLLARLDPDGRLAQSDRSNDETWAELEVAGRFRDAVRLALEPLAREGDAPLAPGDPVDLRTRLRDAGGAPVDAADVEAVLVAPDGSTRSLGRRPVAGPSGGGVLDLAERFLLPPDLDPGSYILRLLLDPDRRLPWEDAAGGQTADLPIVVGGRSRGSDLRAVSATARVGADGRVAVEAVVENRGPDAPAGFDVVLYLATADPRRPGFQVPVETRRLPPGTPAPGRATTVPFEPALENYPAGDYRLIAVVDPEGRSDTISPADNRAETLVRLGAPGAGPVAPSPGGPVAPPAGPQVPPPGPGPSAPSPTQALDDAAASLPVPLVALLPGNLVARDAGTPITILLSRPAETRNPVLVEVSVGVRDSRPGLPPGTAVEVPYAVAEFTVPPGPAGAVVSVAGRIRLPGTVPAGPATLLLVVREELGAARPPLRQLITVR